MKTVRVALPDSTSSQKRDKEAPETSLNSREREPFNTTKDTRVRKKLQYFGCSQAASVLGDQGTPLSVLKLHKSPDLLVRETTDFRVGL